jgi:hypothetical protein
VGGAADLTRPSTTMFARGNNLAHHSPGSRRSKQLLLQLTLDSAHDLEVPRASAPGTPQRSRRRYVPSGSPRRRRATGRCTKSSVPGNPSRPWNPEPFCRQSFNRRKTWRRPIHIFFFTRGPHHPPQTTSSEDHHRNRHRAAEKNSRQKVFPPIRHIANTRRAS